MTSLAVRAFDARKLSDLLSLEEQSQMLGHALDRSVLEGLIRVIAKGEVSTSGRTREALAHAVLSFVEKNKVLRKALSEAVIEATRLERAKLESLEGDAWRDALLPYFSQRRAGAKFLLAIAVLATCEPEPWSERAAHWLTQLRETARQQDEALRRAEEAGVGETFKALQTAVKQESSERSVLAEKLHATELERAAVVAQLGKREAELKRLVEQSQALERELAMVRSSKPALVTLEEEETNALRGKLRKLEKMTAFAREREQERQLRKLLESERDMLLKEVGLLRTQLQLAQQLSNLYAAQSAPQLAASSSAAAVSSPDLTPRADEGARARGVALLIDGANVAGAARRLHERKVDFDKLRAFTLGPRVSGAICHAYVIDNGAQGFAAFHRALVRAGFSVHKRVPKELGDGSVKADQDVQIAVDAMALRDRVHTVVLVSGDGDFVPLVVALKKSGVRVEAAMFRARSARELIDAVDVFLPLGDEILV